MSDPTGMRGPQTFAAGRLLDFLRAQLEVCATRITLAATADQSGMPQAAQRWLAEAELVHATVLRFVTDPKYRLNDNDRRELETRLNAQRQSLNSAREQSRR